MDPSHAKGPDGRSLYDAGFRSAGLDDGWQACGKGVGGSFHGASSHGR